VHAHASGPTFAVRQGRPSASSTPQNGDPALACTAFVRALQPWGEYIFHSTCGKPSRDHQYNRSVRSLKAAKSSASKRHNARGPSRRAQPEHQTGRPRRAPGGGRWSAPQKEKLSCQRARIASTPTVVNDLPPHLAAEVTTSLPLAIQAYALTLSISGGSQPPLTHELRLA